MVPFWVPIIIRPLVFIGYPKRDHNFDNHPYILLSPVTLQVRNLLEVFCAERSQRQEKLEGCGSLGDLNSLKGVYVGDYRGVLQGLLRGILVLRLLRFGV